MSCCKVGIFVTGALVGAAAALLFAPEKGEDTRERIRKAIKRCGVKLGTCQDEIEAIADELAEEIANN